MRAMVLDRAGAPLRLAEIDDPAPGAGQVLLRVAACGVCRTDLHIVDGELTEPKLPLVLGHQIVGRVVAAGTGASVLALGARVGVPWLARADETCRFCTSGRENLCPQARFTGYHVDGGYAELVVADERFCVPLPDGLADEQAAPLLCAGAIGYRALVFAGPAERVGLYGFGSAAHLVLQIARHRRQRVFAFTRANDRRSQSFALSLGAEWAGGTDERPPEPLDAAIIFAPVGDLVPSALRATALGGIVVCAGIHMSALPSMPYELLWGERVLRSVANLTRSDARELISLASAMDLRSRVSRRSLAEANEALGALRAGAVDGTIVLVP